MVSAGKDKKIALQNRLHPLQKDSSGAQIF
jgi:hypothetical protein